VEEGDYPGALDALARPDIGRHPSDPNLEPSTLAGRAECRLGLACRLPAVESGADRPADAREGAEFARLAFARRRYATSTRLWANAFSACPQLAGDLKCGNRFQAARAAALAGAGEGHDELPRGDASQVQWRGQALSWLNADLSECAALLETGSFQESAELPRLLGRWQVDPALSCLRDEGKLSRLPEAERRPLRDLWSRVESLRAKAVSQPATGKP
jgi:hypothetical protein